MVSLVKRAFLIVISLAFATGCNSQRVVVKIYLNENWNHWTAERYGLPYVPQKQIFADCEETLEITKKNDPSVFETYRKNSGVDDGIMKLQEVNANKVISRNDLIHVANVSIKPEETEIFLLQNVWELLGKGKGWNKSGVEVLKTNQCGSLRTMIAGDVIQMPDGTEYVVDEFGFEKLQPIIPAKTVMLKP